jgi:hypothetical protein
MIDLPEVTLVCVDTRTPQLALQAIGRCTAAIRFGAVKLFTDRALLDTVPPEVSVIDLHIDSVPAYSEFMLRGLRPHVSTSHCLVVQWDGYVVDAGRWDPAFLHWDYIGAPLRGIDGPRAVGNGGFSLRSRRLLDALAAPGIVIGHPEDVAICHDNRERLEQTHGIRFAPVEVATRFAYERLAPPGPTFGFHGLFNFHRVMTMPQLRDLLATLPAQMARGLDAHDLCATLITQGELEAAARIIAMRRQLGMHDRRTLRLRLRHAWHLWRQRGFAPTRRPPV